MACRDSALLKTLQIPQRKGAANPRRKVACDEINKSSTLYETGRSMSDVESVAKTELRILYQDDLLIAVEKPSGMFVHRSDADRTATEFVGQEMFREINTIGSKANNVTIAHHVVEMKAAIERVREVLQNVE